VRSPVVERDPLCVTAAIPLEPGLDLQLAPVLNDRVGSDLRRGTDDPVPNVLAEIMLQLLDALGQSPIRGDDNINGRSARPGGG